MVLDLHILGIRDIQFLTRKDNPAGGRLKFQDFEDFLYGEKRRQLGTVSGLNNKHIEKALRKIRDDRNCKRPIVGLRLLLTYAHIDKWTPQHYSTLKDIKTLTTVVKFKYLYIHRDSDFEVTNTFKRLWLSLVLKKVEYCEAYLPLHLLEGVGYQPGLRTILHGCPLTHASFQQRDEECIDKFLGTNGNNLELWAGSVPINALKYFDEHSKLEVVKTVELGSEMNTNLFFDEFERKDCELFKTLTLTGLIVYTLPSTFYKQVEFFELIDSQSESVKRIWTTPIFLNAIISGSSKVFPNTEIIFLRWDNEQNFSDDPVFTAKFPMASFRREETWTYSEIAEDHPHSELSYRSIAGNV